MEYKKGLWPFSFWNSQTEYMKITLNDNWTKYMSNRINYEIVRFMQGENIEG